MCDFNNDSLDDRKSLAEIHGDKWIKVMLNEVTRKMETLKSQYFRQSTIHTCFSEMKL